MENFVFTPSNIKDPMNHPHRIYFSFHTKDIDNIDFISEQIRKIKEDCVIAYAIPNCDEPSLIPKLESFHLTVVFVTENWFLEGSHTREFLHLIKKHKAILPILFDASLIDRFNKTTNNLQFLTIDDPEFSEKLQRTLQDILFDSKLLSKVDKVFTHKMFVSYCREDIDKARQLIRCIHNVEKGKRIAIWYDKYLPMGKNFEESIFSELDNSNFFAVTLTPNLLGRENYVKKYEYPRAKNGNKKITFFELSPVDKAELLTQLAQADEDDYITLENPKELNMYVSDLINNTPGRPDEFNQVDVDYLLGLAYQNSLFVEFDHNYAALKFKSAANNMHADAAHELANMFHYGLGIPRDEEKAASWYKKEVRIVEKKFRREVDKLRQIKASLRTTKGPKTNSMIPVDDSLFDNFTKTAEYISDLVADLIVRCTNNARTLRDNGKMKKAEQIYRIALGALDLIDSVEIQLGLGNHYRGEIENEINQMMLVTGKRDENSLKKIWLNCLRRYNNNPKDYLSIKGLLQSAHNYGVSLIMDGRYDEARKIMIQALNIEAKANKDSITDDNFAIYETTILLHRDIGRSYTVETPASEEQRENNFKESIRRFEHIRSMLENLPFDIDENPYLRFTLPFILIYMGDAYSYNNNHQEALKFYFLAYTEIKNAEKALGNKTEYKDFPISLLEHYTICIQKLSMYADSVLCKFLSDEIEILLHRYSKMNFSDVHAIKAKQYLQSLKEIYQSLKSSQ